MAVIFDKLAGGINRVISSASASSKAAVEKARINSEISNLEKECKQLIQLMGNKVCDLFIENNSQLGDSITIDADTNNFLSEISKRRELVTRHREQLERIEEELRMASSAPKSGSNIVFSCGHENAIGAKFCVICGNPQDDSNNMTSCSCGHANEGDAKFCVGCGNKL